MPDTRSQIDTIEAQQAGVGAPSGADDFDSWEARLRGQANHDPELAHADRLSVDIKELGLRTITIVGALRNLGVETVKELVELTPQQLRSVPSIGYISLDEIQQSLRDRFPGDSTVRLRQEDDETDT